MEQLSQTQVVQNHSWSEELLAELEFYGPVETILY